MLRSPFAGLVLCLFLGASTSATAFAHPLIDQGVRLFQEADFPGALAAFAEAERGTDLTRDDLVTLYRERALVEFALEDAPALSRDLQRLAELAPDHEFDARSHPAFREAWLRACAERGGELRLEAHTSVSDGAVEIEVRARNDSAGLVQTVRVFGRLDLAATGAHGVHAWLESSMGQLRVPRARAQTVEFYAEAVGPGGATVARLATQAAPETVPGELSPPPPRAAPPRRRDDGLPLWIPVIGGAAALVLIAGGIYVATLPSDDSRFTPFDVAR